MKSLKTFWIIYFLVSGLGLGVVYGQNSQHFEHFKIVNQDALKQNYELGEFFDGNPLYAQIIHELGEEYQRIGRRQADLILRDHNSGITGGLNSLGFRFQKDFLDFGTHFSRTLSPDLFDNERWIVNDELIITIDAGKILSNLKDRKIIDISDSNLALFAGMGFKRVYRYIHFANSYSEGLTINLNRLFMGFTAFKKRAFLDMAPYEFALREDYLSVRAGGLGTVPIWGSLTGAFGVLAKYERMAKVEIESLGILDNPSELYQKDNTERFRISYEKTHETTAGVTMSIQADFLNILRLTLLSYDFNYQYKDQYKYYLSFSESDILGLKDGSEKAYAVDEILKGKAPNISILADNLVSLERRQIERMNMRYSLLIYGGHREEETSSIEMVKDGVVKNFFRHNFEKIKYKEGILSHLFAGVIKKLLGLNSIVNKEASEIKRVRMEYESEKDLIAKKENLYFYGDEHRENLSLSFRTEYRVQDTLKGSGKKEKKKALEVLNNYSGVDPLAIELFEKNELRGPVKIAFDFKLGYEAINHLNSLSNAEILKIQEQTCKNESKTIMRFFRSLFNNCKKNLKKDYELYAIESRQKSISHNDYLSCEKQVKKLFRSFKRKRELTVKCLEKLTLKSPEEREREIPLWRLKDFLGTLHKYSNTKVDIYDYFGIKNTFMYGNFEAMTIQDTFFNHHFTEGKFRGLGLIENNLVNQNLRMPASVIIE